MTASAEKGACLLILFQSLPMATDALVVKSPLQVGSRIRPMTRRTADVLFSFLQRTFIEDVLPVFIEMMAVLAGKSGFGVTIMRKGHCRSCLSPQDL
jgi:hypothetical protein